MTVDVVAFDLMDTVIRDPYREALEAATGRPLREIFRHREPGSWPRFERGELTEDEFLATFDGIDFDRDAFHRARWDGYAWVPGMRSLLRDLGGVVRRVIASNYPVWIEDVAERLLADLVDDVVASHHLGVRKPDPGFYVQLCERLGARPAAVLFVDDREENVEAAVAAGMPGHLFAGADDLRERLRQAGIDVASTSLVQDAGHDLGEGG